jgi:hypothetical protein
VLMCFFLLYSSPTYVVKPRPGLGSAYECRASKVHFEDPQKVPKKYSKDAPDPSEFLGFS